LKNKLCSGPGCSDQSERHPFKKASASFPLSVTPYGRDTSPKGRGAFGIRFFKRYSGTPEPALKVILTRVKAAH